MAVSNCLKAYVSFHSLSESFLYNNRMILSREINADQYNLNQDYVLARRSEQGF
jgi:hypothetical protein